MRTANMDGVVNNFSGLVLSAWLAGFAVSACAEKAPAAGVAETQVEKQMEKSIADFPGSGIKGWGGKITQRPPGRSGLYANENPPTTGGASQLIRLPTGRLLALHNNRDLSPYIFRRFSDDDVFFSNPEGLESSLPVNGIAPFVKNRAEAHILGGAWPNGGTVKEMVSFDLGKTVGKAVDRGLLVAICQSGIVLSSGTILVPIHFAKPSDHQGLYCKVGVLRSEDGGETWEICGEIQTAGSSLCEPAIVEAGEKVLMIIRREAHDGIYIQSPWYQAWGSDDGLHWDAVAVPVEGVATPTRVGGNPPSLIKLVDGGIGFLYAPGSGEPYWKVYTSSDGISWRFVCDVHAVEPGTNPAFRYMTAVERRAKGSLLIMASEPDIASRGAQQCVLWLSPTEVVELKTEGSPYVNRLSCPEQGKVYFDTYLTATAIGAGPRTHLEIGSEQGVLARWVFASAGSNDGIFYVTGEDMRFSNKSFFLNKEKRLRVVYDLKAGTLDYWVNDTPVAVGVAPVAGWSGRPDRQRLIIQDGTSSFDLRENIVFQPIPLM